MLTSLRLSLSSFSFFFCLLVVGPVSPRTLILTEEQIVLCEEDYGRASNTFAAKQIVSQVQFSKAIVHPVSDVVAIVKDAELIYIF